MTLPRLNVRQNQLFAFSLLLLTLTALLAGCSRKADDETLSAADGSPVSLTYAGPNSMFIATEEEVAIERFQEQMPGIEINHQPTRNDGTANLLDDPPPDVMLLTNGHGLDRSAERGLLSDLSDIWSDNNLAEIYGEQFRNLSRVEGKLHFVPSGFSWTGVYYNKEVFERYGLSPPATWEEFERICDTLLANAETPLSLAGQNPFFSTLWFEYLNMRLNGPEFHHNLISGRESYSDERVAVVLELWISLMGRGFFNENASSIDGSASMAALPQEKAVMTLAPHFVVGELSADDATKLDFFQFPQMDAGLPVGEVSMVFGYVIPANAVNHVQAREFVSYMGSAEAHTMKLRRIGENAEHAAYVPVHSEIEQDLLSPAVEKGAKIVRGADQISPTLMLALPSSMQGALVQVLQRLFMQTDNPIPVSEMQTILEEARQNAIQNGEYAE